MNIEELIRAEGWTIGCAEEPGSKPYVLVYGDKYPVVHPFQIHCKIYRETEEPEKKYQHLRRMHDLLWPHQAELWHYWTERKFREHCGDTKFISLAGGAGAAKSFDMAKLVLLFWFSDPKNNAVVVASTTLSSLESRVWGYILNLVKEMSVPLKYGYRKSKPPCFTFEDDPIHGIFAVAAKKGEDEKSIAEWIGRHPNKKLMVVLDEGPDLPIAVLKATHNLDRAPWFQLWCLGNSCSRFDLHGALSTPKIGWDNISPKRDIRWETTQERGVCLYFSPYESPAIWEVDEVKKERLGVFLITQEKLDGKKKELGEDNFEFWRFVLGFWKSGSTDKTVISEAFLDKCNVTLKSEWSGLHQLSICGGLDPAFSTGGDQCIFRLGVIGVDSRGQVVLDYRDETLLFRIKIVPSLSDPAEVQIADQVIQICKDYHCEISNIVIDANGQGRALGSVIHLKSGSLKPPLKIYSMRVGEKAVNSFDVIVKTSHELWYSFREFMMHEQIRGLDRVSAIQLSSRFITEKGGKQVLESKADFKARMGAIMPTLARSPDEADAASLVLQSAIINFGFKPGAKVEIRQPVGWVDTKMHTFLNEQKEKPKNLGQVFKPAFTGSGKLSRKPF